MLDSRSVTGTWGILHHSGNGPVNFVGQQILKHPGDLVAIPKISKTLTVTHHYPSIPNPSICKIDRSMLLPLILKASAYKLVVLVGQS